MNRALATSLDQISRSSIFPMWLTLAAAGFFALILLVTLLRAEKSVANGALTVITLLAIGIAVAATTRDFGPGGGPSSRDAAQSPQFSVSLPALSCIDDLAGDSVAAACEKALFGSADSVAAAVSYAAGRLSRLTAMGDVSAANKSMSPELDALRRSVERDRYGLIAHVLATREHCEPARCTAFRSLSDYNQVATNMAERTYDGLIARYEQSWNAPVATVAALSQPAPQMAPPPAPGTTGKPTTADFPSAASIPPVNIMTPEPLTGMAAAARPAPLSANAQSLAPPPATPAAPAAPRKTTAPKTRASAPVKLAPPAPKADN
jgi:hypothetical protein